MKKTTLAVVTAICLALTACSQLTNTESQEILYSAENEDSGRYIYTDKGSSLGTGAGAGANDTTIGILIPGNASSKPSSPNNPGSSKKGGK